MRWAATGTRTHSLMEVKSGMEKKRNVERDLIETMNPDVAPGRRWWSMRMACSTEKVVIWDYTA
jgi:hypothetical protein